MLYEPRRVSAFLADLAGEISKPQKIALIKTLEHGFVRILKDAAATEREKYMQQLAQRLHDEEGLDLDLCANAVDLLEAALFREQQEKIYCNNCGKELQKEWLACPYCKTVIQDAGSPSKETKAEIDKLQNNDAHDLPEKAWIPLKTKGEKIYILVLFLILVVLVIVAILNK